MTPTMTSDLPIAPPVLATVADLRAAVTSLRRTCRRIGLVPTMGALHEGHLSLVRAASLECDATLVTIFVNPTQFGPHEDFSNYPRTLAADLNLLAPLRVAGVFAPTHEQMYPADCSTAVDPPRVSIPWEGTCRPGHFRGVATIVLKLFHLIPADVAYFGQKDFQQCRVIECMVRDLDLPIIIRRCPIIREPDGLAMSSRNRYLSPGERHQAAAISRSLRTGQQAIHSGETQSGRIQLAMRRVLADAGIDQVEYLTVADSETLAELEQVDRRAVLLVAARVGRTRLIDNCLIEPQGMT